MDLQWIHNVLAVVVSVIVAVVIVAVVVAVVIAVAVTSVVVIVAVIVVAVIVVAIVALLEVPIVAVAAVVAVAVAAVVGAVRQSLLRMLGENRILQPRSCVSCPVSATLDSEGRWGRVPDEACFFERVRQHLTDIKKWPQQESNRGAFRSQISRPSP